VVSFHPGAAGTGDAPDALLIIDGRVAAVGSARELRPPAGAQVLDLPGATITPGLTDAHIHVTEWALARREVDLAPATSPEDAARIVAAHSHAGTAGWVRGRGWNPHRWRDASPSRSLLDAVVPDRPVALQSHDMHSVWVNSPALRLAGISADTVDPPGGRIVRDDMGRPTGLLMETAGQLIARCIPAPSHAEMLDAVADAQIALHQLGITGIHSLPGILVPEPDPLSILEALRARDRLRLRVLQHLPLHFLDDAVKLGIRSGFGGDWIRIGGIKSFLDGTLGSRTASMRWPYEGADDCGIRVIEATDFREAVRKAALAGLATTVHAIGDAAVALAIDVLADPTQRVDAIPHRIEHVQCFPAASDARASISDDDRFDRTVRARITCSMQPAHLISDWRAADRHWGDARARWTYAFRSLLDRGALLAFGSDAPVEPADPRLGLFAATRRTDLAGEPAGGWFRGERITLEEALRGYTVGPAIAAGRTGREGQLTPGAVADFVAWDTDPFADGLDPLELSCALTVVDGEVVHS
jgi:predicted amidohydrolase YtcJ